MPILLKHSGNATPAAVAAYGGGKGQREQQIASTVGPVMAQQSMSRANRISEELNAEKGRALQREGWKAEEERQRIRQRWASGEALRNRVAERDEAEAARRHEIQKMAIVEDTYTRKQREEYNRLSESLEEARRSGEWTPDELAALEKQIIAKQADIRPTSVMRKPQESAAERGRSEIFAQDGGIWTKEADGTLKRTGDDPKVIKQEVLANLYKDGVALAQVETDPAKRQGIIDAYVADGIKRLQSAIQPAAAALPGGGGTIRTEDGRVMSIAPDGSMTDVNDFFSQPPDQLDAQIREIASSQGVDIAEAYDRVRQRAIADGVSGDAIQNLNLAARSGAPSYEPEPDPEQIQKNALEWLKRYGQ